LLWSAEHFRLLAKAAILVAGPSNPPPGCLLDPATSSTLLSPRIVPLAQDSLFRCKTVSEKKLALLAFVAAIFVAFVFKTALL
jgi:hypothetical protein